MFGHLIYECRIEVLRSIDESAIKDLLKNPDVHKAAVVYHQKAAAQTKDLKAKTRHMAQIRHHSKQADRLRRGGKTSEEGAGDPGLHTKSAELLGRRGRYKPERANR